MQQDGSYILFHRWWSDNNLRNSKAIPFEVVNGNVVARTAEEFTLVTDVINNTANTPGLSLGERSRAVILPRANLANRPTMIKSSDPPDNSLKTPVTNARTIRLHNPNFPGVPAIARDRTLVTTSGNVVTVNSSSRPSFFPPSKDVANRNRDVMRGFFYAVAATNPTTNSIEVSWNGFHENVMVKWAAGPWWPAGEAGPFTGLSATIQGLIPTTPYQFELVPYTKGADKQTLIPGKA